MFKGSDLNWSQIYSYVTSKESNLILKVSDGKSDWSTP